LIIISGLLAILIIAIIVFLDSYTYRVYRAQKINDHTFLLPQTYTLEQAKKDGIVDVSVVSNGKNTKIEKFLYDVSQNKVATLRTANINHNGKLIITLYTNDIRFQVIRIFEYGVVSQGATGYHVSQEYRVSKENDSYKIWLQTVPNPAVSPEFYEELYEESIESVEFVELLLYAWEG
jgi:hypothetical protein